MNIEFDSELVYCDTTKIKSYGDKVSTNFQGKKVPKKCMIQMFVTDNVRFFCQSKTRKYCGFNNVCYVFSHIFLNP